MRDSAVEEYGLWQAVQDWWALGFTVGAAAIAYIAGRERQRTHLDDLVRRVDAQEVRLRDMERQQGTDGKLLVEIRTQQNSILSLLKEVKDDLKGKADK